METSGEFEMLLAKHRIAVERYINYRLSSSFDADDVIQKTYLAAFLNFGKLRDRSLFKPWILSIAKNQCNLWYRERHGAELVSIEALGDTIEAPDVEYDDTVLSVIKKLPREYAQILKLTMGGYKQSQIANMIGIPVGTVKSRLHYAKKLFRAACPPEITLMYERGSKTMTKKDCLCGFPMEMPALKIVKKDVPFFEVKCEDESFIIPRVGNKNSEGTYRYPDKRLALVSTCHVPKAAVIHDVPGVKVCRDTYNVRADKLYKNEAVWFTQLTDEYIRDLGTVRGDAEGDDEYPTEITTFLDEDYDVRVNGNDRVHGRPLLIKENPPKIEGDELCIDTFNIRYTMGVYDVTIGGRTFETVKCILPQNNYIFTESYIDRAGRLVMVRWYETVESIECDDIYPDGFIERIKNNPTVKVNGVSYVLVEDMISEYAL